MPKFTRRQREELLRRIERQILWTQSTTSQRDAARFLAARIIDDLDHAGMGADATRRAVVSIADRVEQAS